MIEKLIFDQPQPQIVYGILGDTYIYANEREVEVEMPLPMEGEIEGDAEPQTVTKYEYDVRHFPLSDKTEAGALERLKYTVLVELEKFDSSDEVNGFSLNGTPMWLDKETRNGLRLRFDSQKALGQSETTLWYGVTPIALNIDTAIQMLQVLEVYASGCYDRTAAHKAAIANLTTIDEVFNYDYKSGYPAKLAF